MPGSCLASRKQKSPTDTLHPHLRVGAERRTIFVDCAAFPKFPIVLTQQSPMNDQTPHFVLMTEASRAEGLGHWRFMLRPDDGSGAVEVADVEPDIWGERLDLLTVVRALESLDQPSRGDADRLHPLRGAGNYVRLA